MRKLFGGPAEDLCEPPDSFLMRYVDEGAVAEDIHQGVLGGIRPPVRHLLRRPKVPSPGHERQYKETRDGNCYKNCYQNSSSYARKSRPQRLPNSRRRLGLDFKRQSCPLVERDESTAFNRSIAVAFQFGGRPR
jgi:hypothetical protein